MIFLYFHNSKSIDCIGGVAYYYTEANSFKEQHHIALRKDWKRSSSYSWKTNIIEKQILLIYFFINDETNLNK